MPGRPKWAILASMTRASGDRHRAAPLIVGMAVMAVLFGTAAFVLLHYGPRWFSHSVRGKTPKPYPLHTVVEMTGVFASLGALAPVVWRINDWIGRR